MEKFSGSVKRLYVLMASIGMSLGFIMLSATVALSQPLPINSMNFDPIIKGGTYGNTVGNATVFHNPNGLWLQSGVTVKGVQVNSNNNQINGNGGYIVLDSPTGVVRIDGDINVNGINAMNRLGIGSGGKVTVNATYLYQSGRISAVGENNSGLVIVNVNSATFAPTASIDVRGAGNPTGAGGKIDFNGQSVVDFQRNCSGQMAVMDASGRGGGSVNSDFIDIDSGLVNNSGLLRATGVQGQGGTVRLTTADTINLQPVANVLAKTKIFTPAEAQAQYNSLSQLVAKLPPGRHSGVINTGEINADGATASASGTSGRRGGFVELQTVYLSNTNTGNIHANGGNGTDGAGAGGVISFFDLTNNGIIAANGGDVTAKAGAAGGGGGVIRSSARNTFLNSSTGLIEANGGNASMAQGGRGGIGGTLNLNVRLNNVANRNFGRFLARGGQGSNDYSGKGGDGGAINEQNIYNQPGSEENVSGGAGSTPGKPGTLNVLFTQ